MVGPVPKRSPLVSKTSISPLAEYRPDNYMLAIFELVSVSHAGTLPQLFSQSKVDEEGNPKYCPPMSKASANILRSLTQENRELFTQKLSESGAAELLDVKGIGFAKLSWFLGDHIWTKEHLRTLKWPKLTECSGDIVYRKLVDGPPHRRPQPLTQFSKIFNKKDILRLLAHYSIPLESDINEHLTELRDLALRLDIFKAMGNPVINDYLKGLLVRLSFD